MSIHAVPGRSSKAGRRHDRKLFAIRAISVRALPGISGKPQIFPVQRDSRHSGHFSRSDQSQGGQYLEVVRKGR